MVTRTIPLDTVPLDISVKKTQNVKAVKVNPYIAQYMLETEQVCALPAQVVFQINAFREALKWTLKSGVLDTISSSKATEPTASKEDKKKKKRKRKEGEAADKQDESIIITNVDGSSVKTKKKKRKSEIH